MRASMLTALAMTLVLSFSTSALANHTPNLLTNGDLEATTAFYYYDNNVNNTGTATDIPGWEAFANADTSSWVQISENSVPNNTNLDLSGSDASNGPTFVGLAGIQTVAASRVPVTPGNPYHATVTTDNYFGDAGISYWIDWFDGGGSAVGSSVGGLLGDPNGPFTYEPLTQLFQISGVAPAGAASAGVRFQSATGTFNGAAADNFTFGAGIPEPSSIALAASAAIALGLVVRRRKQSM